MKRLQRLLFCLTIGTSPAGAAVILMYHHVDANTPDTTSISPELFKRQLEWIAASEYPVLPLETLIEKALQEDTDAVALTFDDGYASVYTHAFPLLRARNWPFTIFVNPARIGQSKRYASWAELKEMREHGATIANHTWDHPHLIDLTPAAIREQLLKAQRTLQQALGHAPKLLAYPYGEFDQRVKAEAQALGFKGFAQHSGAVGPNTDPLNIPRFPMTDRYGQEKMFKIKLRTRPLPWTLLNEDTIWDQPGVPELVFRLPDDLNHVSCFADGQGAIFVKRADAYWIVRARRAFSQRRFKYTCTHPDADGRFYWSSRLWIQPRIME